MHKSSLAGYPPAAEREDVPMDIVGGYRLVRKLGSGERAEVYLGHAGTGEAGAARVAAIKLYRPQTDDRSIGTEIEALDRASSRHLVRLTDLATDADGRTCLILKRVGPVSLARFLVERDSLRPGEAVTVLAPLVQAVADLHRVGVAHRALRLSNVLFDGTGAPVLIGFGSAALLGQIPGSKAATTVVRRDDPRLLADLDGLAVLCRSVLDRTGGLTAEVLEGLYRCLDAMCSGDLLRIPEELSARIFELGEPVPLPLGEQPAPLTMGEQPAPALGGPAQRTAAAAVARVPGPASTRSLIRPVMPRWASAHTARHSTRRARGRVRRGPALVAGALGVGLLVLGLAAIPTDGASQAGAAHRSAPASLEPSAPQQVTADDPATAARALLETRARCLRDAAVACLQVVDQADSAALEDDREFIRTGSGTDQEDLLYPVTDTKLIQRLGDTALIAVEVPGAADPVSLLLIRANGAWRIRDILGG